MVVYPTCPKTIRKGRLPRIIQQFSLDTDLLWSHRWYSLDFLKAASSCQALDISVTHLYLRKTHELYCNVDFTALFFFLLASVLLYGVTTLE